ncbi:MAG: hypothetical protein ABJJ43_00005 [Ekhidna sp.]
MLFLGEYMIKTENRVATWNTFGNMTLEEHEQSLGEVKLLGRWHHLNGGGGIDNYPCMWQRQALQSMLTDW